MKYYVNVNTWIDEEDLLGWVNLSRIQICYLDI